MLIMTDDQPPDTLSFMPNVQEELIENGALFENAFVSTPLCSPSRASILTGKYASNHGVLINRPPEGGAPAFDDISTIATWLDDAGYNTSFMGKYLNDYDAVSPFGYIPPGWDDWQVFIEGPFPNKYFYNYTLNENGDLVEYGKEEEDYSSDVLNSKAVDFIHESKDEPFFLVLSYYAPHYPRKFAERHRDMFQTPDQIAPRRPENFNEEDMSDKPEWIHDRKFAIWHRMDKIYQQALRSLMAVDDGVGEVMQALDDIGQRENTMIIYMSDNGIAWGEHRLTGGKNCPYEECIQIPFIIYYPRLNREGRSCDQMVLNIDVAPTIAQVAGIEIPKSVDGVSLVPLMDKCDGEFRSDFLIEHWPTKKGSGSKIPKFRAIRTKNWKYVEYETGEIELYDIFTDKSELNNLSYKDNYRSIIEQLDSRLDEILNK